MDEFLRFVISHLVEFPEEVVVVRVDEPDQIIFRVSMRKTDLGKLIGKGGHTIQSIRNLLQAAAEKHRQKVVLEIIE